MKNQNMIKPPSLSNHANALGQIYIHVTNGMKFSHILFVCSMFGEDDSFVHCSNRGLKQQTFLSSGKTFLKTFHALPNFIVGKNFKFCKTFRLIRFLTDTF